MLLRARFGRRRTGNGYDVDMVTRRDGRPRRPWSDRSRAEKYAFIQSQVLFWGLYLVAMYLVATHVGVWFAVVAFGGGIVLTAAATVLGIRRRRDRNR
jgi:hypothetical protein